jgi:probable F420-dependent oxidoreductase
VDLGRIGVWWSGSWQAAADPSLDIARELEALGYGAIWSTGGFKPGLSSRFERLLASTKHMIIASGIVNIWLTPTEEITTAVADLDVQYPGRFLLGLGASHAAVVEHYHRPFSRMVEYLDAMDAVEPSVLTERRVLAALGPRMLRLAAERSAGAHPYFVPVEHTARARQFLGSHPLLAPEVTVILERNPTKARDLARTFTAGYLTLPNYRNNLRSLGFGDDDLAAGGSDRLVDAVVAWGDVETVVSRIHQHHDAGADHVCVQIVSPTEGFPIDEYRVVADSASCGD